MKPTLFALTALGALAAASPAAAQTYNGYGSQNGYYNNGSQYQNGYYGQSYDTRYGNSGYNGYNGYNNGYGAGLNSSAAIETRIARLDQRLQAGIRAGTIDRDEAMRLRAELRDLRSLSRRYAYNGLTASERADLLQRLRSVREDIRVADNGSWDRYDRDDWGSSNGYRTYGYGTNGYGTNGYSSNGYGTNGYGTNGYGTNGYGSNGYGSNGYGTNGYSSYNNGYYGQGGPYEEADEGCRSRSGVVGGVIDSVFGRDCAGSLRVGERATGSLYGVPDEYQGQYRDSYNYYYRSDGRAIYQIDARTNTVLRVYPMGR